MNEFLKNLRAQQKGNVSYSSQGDSGYPHPDRRSGNERRGTSSRKQSSGMNSILKKINDILPDFKTYMISMADNQERIIDLVSRWIEVEERRNEIFENLTEKLSSFQGGVARDISGDAEDGEIHHRKIKKIPKEERDKTMDLIYKMREKGATYEEVADYLETQHIPTFSNKGRWHAQTIHRLYQQRKKELGV